MKKVWSVLFLCLAALLVYLCWWPIRAWCFSGIPVTASWAGIAKIAVVVLLAWGGGITLPLICLIGSIGFWIAD